MTNKQRLLSLFSEDVEYNYHIISTTEPNGNLIYLIKNGLELNTDSLEFSQLKIAEELIGQCSVKIEKLAPAIYFTDEIDIKSLSEKLDIKISKNSDFSFFIDSIKDEYRILEVKDSLLYKKDPEAYEEAKQKEHNAKQKDLWGEYTKQIEGKAKQREEALMAYENDLMKLLKEYFEGIIEYEKRDFDFTTEFQKIIGNLVNPETWIKINDRPYVCRIDLLSLEKDRVNVYLTDNNDYSYTATLRFQGTMIETENIVKIEIGDIVPNIISDYEVLSLLYDVDLTSVKDWEFKNETERFEYVIDYLVPIFKEAKEAKTQAFLKSLSDAENSEEEVGELLENPLDMFGNKEDNEEVTEVFNEPTKSLTLKKSTEDTDEEEYENIL